jgi:CRISPR-associated protein Cmr2
MNQQYLFLFTIGPVQSFIAQARKTQDLFAGSRMLSELARVGIKLVLSDKFGGELIFPSDANAVSIPNRFMVQFHGTEANALELGRETKQEVRNKFKDIAQNSLRIAWGMPKSADDKLNPTKKLPDSTTNAFNQQIEQFLEIFWALEPVLENAEGERKVGYEAAYKRLERSVGGLKNKRIFEQFNYQEGIGETGRKCNLDGERNALFFGKDTATNLYRWNKGYAVELENAYKVTISTKEGLSAPSLAKRFYKLRNEKRGGFYSTAKIALLYDLNQIDIEGTQFQKIIKDCYPHMLPKDKRSDTESDTLFDDQLYYEENLTLPYFQKNGLEDQLNSLPELRKHQRELQSYLKTRYYALVLFDGDLMGQWFSGKMLKGLPKSWHQNPDSISKFHKGFSGILSDFATKIRSEILDDIGKGETVYAGGDDFLGFVNIHNLFEVMSELRTYCEKIDEEIKLECDISKEDTIPNFTFSAGIVIAHYKMPLAEVLKSVRKAESEAKKPRNAFCISTIKHSGETQQATFKWGNTENSIQNWQNLGTIVKALKEKTFSGKFITNLALEIYQLGGFSLLLPNDSSHERMIELEISRLVNRAKAISTSKEEAKELSDSVFQLYTESKRNVENFIHSLEIADFMSRKTNHQ